MKGKHFFIGFIFICLYAFTAIKDTDPKAQAVIERWRGMYIFYLSKPSNSYDYIGSVKIRAAWTGAAKELLDRMVNNVKKDYPQADGIIFTTVDMYNADAIKFK